MESLLLSTNSVILSQGVRHGCEWRDIAHGGKLSPVEGEAFAISGGMTGVG